MAKEHREDYVFWARLNRYPDRRAIANAYFRDVLFAVTGVRPPNTFKFSATDEAHEAAQRAWAEHHARPDWVSGESLLVAARALVMDAHENGSILSRTATNPSDFEVSVRTQSKRRKEAERKKRFAVPKCTGVDEI